MYTPVGQNPRFAAIYRTLRIYVRRLITSEIDIYVAILRQAVASLGHVRSCTLPRLFLAFLVLLVSPHLTVTETHFMSFSER